MPPVIEVDHVTKQFRLGQITSLTTTVMNAINRVIGRPMVERAPFKALDDVSFQVKQGEVLGIIGHNGAGKSTMLKILAGISQPSQGKVTVRGRVAPLIEVGAGLVPDMTGRENIFLNASILGMKRAEIKRSFDEIVAFAELEDFIDTPVKRYSSGMQVRLGFSIATSVQADILIVDEVLAVGDLAFQRKCFDRMEQLIQGNGRTVLIVSHNIRQVERLCNRALLLDHGKTAATGEPKDVCEAFYLQSNTKISAQVRESHRHARDLRMSGEVLLEALVLVDENGIETNTVKSGSSIIIRGTFKLSRTLPQAEVIFGFHTTDFVYIASMGTAHIDTWPDLLEGTNIIECSIGRLPLVPGVYGIRVGVLDRSRREVFYGENIKIFSVAAGAVPVSKMAVLGLVDIPAVWCLE